MARAKVVVIKCDAAGCRAEVFIRPDGNTPSEGWVTRAEPLATTHWCPAHAHRVEDVA